MEIKQLKQGNQIIVPQTTAEAVLVKENGRVVLLSDVLQRKSGPLKILINGEQYITRDEEGNDTLKLGDDFTTDNDNNVVLNWNNVEYGST